MSGGKQTRKRSFLEEISRNLSQSIFILRDRTSFSLQFLDTNQAPGANFSSLTNEQLVRLCDKLRAYCREPIEYWQRQRIGGAKQHVFERYGEFPLRSGFSKPTSVPNEVIWGRFRLEGDFRLAGFIVDDKNAEELRISKNTFYIVFIDPRHQFYLG